MPKISAKITGEILYVEAFEYDLLLLRMAKVLILHEPLYYNSILFDMFF